jgi:hypothetical protein
MFVGYVQSSDLMVRCWGGMLGLKWSQQGSLEIKAKNIIYAKGTRELCGKIDLSAAQERPRCVC